jgi:ElaB/YqjD/DUF883 family membrane-anchored ribosome-binding protein
MNESIDSSKAKLIADFNLVVEDTEKLLRALAATGAEKGSALRASAEQHLESAKQTLGELQADALERSRAAAKATDDYVRENPWRSIGIVAGVAVAVGLVIGLLTNRR